MSLENYKPYWAPPLAAAAAIVYPFRDLVIKSAQQKGLPAPKISLIDGLKGGLRAAPTVGAIVGSQLVLKKLLDNTNEVTLATTLGTPAVVGLVSAPLLAVFNGQTMGLTWTQSLLQLRVKVCAAIALQETAFIAGVAAGEQMNKISSNPAVACVATYLTGASGSLAGHAFNTAVTRWQCNMTVSARQLFWGAARKSHAIGVFSILYTYGNNYLQRGSHE